MNASDPADVQHDAGATYRSTRLRLTALLDGLPADVSAQPVPACPGWDVRDVIAHLVGIVDDALAGRLNGPPAPEQTAAQVARSRRTPLAELLTAWAWASAAVDFEAAVSELPIWPAAIDVVTHDLDVRGALGRHDGRDHPDVRTVAEQLLVGRHTAPTLCFDLGDIELMTAGGPPSHRLRTTAFEVTRICRPPGDLRGDPRGVVNDLSMQLGPTSAYCSL